MSSQDQQQFDTFSKELVPSKDYTRIGSETADRIFNVLKQMSRFSIDRAKIVGSVEKNTAICVEPDFDLVIFVNGQEPDFKNSVLADFHDILCAAEIQTEDMEFSDNSIQFKIDNIPFNLLPATNFVKVAPELFGMTLAQLQADCALKTIRRKPAVGYRYGSAFSEQVVEFVNKQSPYVHDVICLAKFWNKTLYYMEKMPGRSTMIELVAISAARELETEGNKSCFDGFLKFLKLMFRFDKICVIFPEFYCTYDIPCDVMEQRPLVLDPVNPYYNYGYAAIKKPRITSKFKKIAWTTLLRCVYSYDLEPLFEIQPKELERWQLWDWLVDEESRKILNPEMEVRISAQEYQAKEWKVKDVQQCLLTSIATDIEWKDKERGLL